MTEGTLKRKMITIGINNALAMEFYNYTPVKVYEDKVDLVYYEDEYGEPHKYDEEGHCPEEAPEWNKLWKEKHREVRSRNIRAEEVDENKCTVTEVYYRGNDYDYDAEPNGWVEITYYVDAQGYSHKYDVDGRCPEEDPNW